MVEEPKTVKKTTETKETKAEVKEEKSAKFSQEDLDGVVHKRIMQERKKWEDKLAGHDLTDLVSAKESQDEAEKKRDIDKGNFEKVLKDAADKHKEEVSSLKKQVHNMKVDEAIVNAASKHNAVDPEQVMTLVKPTVRINKDSDIEITDANNQKRYNADGKPLSVDYAVKEFLTNNPHFQRAGQSGSGSEGKIGGGKTSPFDILNMSSDELADKMRDPDFRDKYNKEHRSKRSSRIDVKTG